MEQVSIEELQAAQIEEAIEVLAGAFSRTTNPMPVSKGQRDKERHNRATFGFILRHFPGTILIAKKDSRVVGVMRMAEWPRCQLSPLQVLRLLPTMLFEMRRTTPHMLRRRLIAYRKDPKRPHWHLAPIGVVPELQGQGIGSQLLARFCENVDAVNSAAYLETDKPENVRLYERFGFSVTGETWVLGTRYWLMWRSPRNIC